MRVSADESDSGHELYKLYRQHDRRIVVHLDGVKVDDVVTADEERGTVVLCVRDPKAPHRFLLEGDSVARETRQGKVVVGVV